MSAMAHINTARGLQPFAALPSSAARAGELADGWLDLWNGDLSQADRVLSTDFRTHAAMTGGGDGSEVGGRAGLAAWVEATRVLMPDLWFTVQVGPIVSGDHLALRWHARGTYAGGMSGAAAPAGTVIDFTGTDVLRIADGRLCEYWVNSDTLQMMAQLQAFG